MRYAYVSKLGFLTYILKLHKRYPLIVRNSSWTTSKVWARVHE